ncbi:MAG: hypothetical protein GY795_37295, partial [Desulfobacterales bacterium]|nr:hypothetical protein [Desulfobacterales bacterium]
HKAKFSKDRDFELYHVLIRCEEQERKTTEKTEKTYSPAAVQPDLVEVPQAAPGSIPIETLSGVDFYKHSLYLDWKDPTLLNTLYDFKDEMNSDDSSNSPLLKPDVLQLNDGTEFIVSPTSLGKYTLGLQSADIRVLFSKHKSDAQFPNCRIEIGSMSCWHPGWLYLYEQITAWLKGHGAEIVKQKISEFHITSDLLNLDYNLTGFADVNRWQARANRYSLHGEHYVPNYISFGKGDFMFRCYDKTGELKKDSAKSDFFHDIWREDTGHDVEHVTRLEFQIRRQVIKDLKIKSAYDLSKKLNAVWAYCVGDGKENKGWCRFLDRSMTVSDRKNKNQQRYDTDQLWEIVRNVRFGEGRTFHLVREKTQHINVEQLSMMVAGCVSTLCGAMGLDEDDVEGHINLGRYFVEDQLKRNYHKDPKEYKRKILVKHNIAEVIF